MNTKSQYLSTESAFAEVAQLIEASRNKALRSVNRLLIELYWQVGAYISSKLASAEWGEGVVDQLAEYLARNQPSLRGFTRSNLFRMRQFYEAYKDDEKVAPLVRQLSWTHNIVILGQCKRPDEREFYLEALDRQARKPHENPAIGVLLCASKDDEVVEYALSRSLSPALIAEYQTQLPDKRLLQIKLQEFYAQNINT